MSVENNVLLAVALFDAMIVGACIWSSLASQNNSERRRAALEKLNARTGLFGLALFIFSGNELYKWYATKQLYYGGRIGPGVEVSLTSHPMVFAMLGALYSLTCIGCTCGILIFGYEAIRALRENAKIP